MDDTWIADWPVGERWNHFTRANAGEVLPTPATPLGQQLCWDRGIIPGWRDGYVRTGNYDVAEFDPEFPECAAFFGGYFFINLSNVRMQGVRSPAVTVEQLDLAFFGDHPDVPPHVEHPLDERPDLTAEAGEHLGWLMSTTSWPELDDEKAETLRLRADRPDLRSLSDADLVARARSLQPLLAKLFETHTITSSGSGVAPGILAAVGAAIGDPSIAMKLVAGIGEVDSAEPSYRMWELSRQVAASEELTAAFDAGLDGLCDRLRASGSPDADAFLAGWSEFLVDFGSRGPNEWELSSDVWETKPALALAALDRTRFQDDAESPAIRNKRRADERRRLTTEVRQEVADLGDPELAGQFEAALVAASQLAFRERSKTNIIRAVHEVRMTLRELGRRHAESGALAEWAHVWMLLDDEVEAFVDDPASFTDTLADRYGRWQELWQIQPPFIIRDGKVPPLTTWRRRGETRATVAEVGDVLQGVPGCPGVVRGIARVVVDAGDPSALEPGDIMIAPVTDPAWTPLFMTAGGVVVDVGGQISHAIIVSRELGLPCVVSAESATERIPDGALVEVDGDTGRVTVLEAPATD